MSRRIRWAAGAAAVLGLLPGLAACTPGPWPMIAVRSVGGDPVVLLAGCDDFRIDRISVYPTSPDPTESTDGPRRRIERTGTVVPDSMPLFGPPPAGWTVTDDGLTEPAPGGLYGLGAASGTDDAVPVNFTVEDLAPLGPDEVLVGRSGSGQEKVTEQEFRRRAGQSC
jgi:hypothetical protein